jgi:hypothetical protein
LLSPANSLDAHAAHISTGVPLRQMANVAAGAVHPAQLADGAQLDLPRFVGSGKLLIALVSFVVVGNQVVVEHLSLIQKAHDSGKSVGFRRFRRRRIHHAPPFQSS